MPKNNKQVRAATRKALNRAEKALCDQFTNRKITKEANRQIARTNIKNLMEEVGDKAIPYMKLAVAVMEQGREALEVCACPAAICYIYKKMSMLYEKGEDDISKIGELCDYIEIILLCIKNKFEFKDNVAYILLQNIDLLSVEIQESHDDSQYYKESRNILCLKTNDGVCNGFYLLRDPTEEEKHRPLLIDYAMIDKAYRRKGVFSGTLKKIADELSTTGVMLYVEHHNKAMINLMKKVGAICWLKNDVSKVSTYYYGLKREQVCKALNV